MNKHFGCLWDLVRIVACFVVLIVIAEWLGPHFGMFWIGLIVAAVAVVVMVIIVARRNRERS